jgi:hypothetical protein
MLLRVGALNMLTGAVFMAMAWLDPLGPLAIILGSGCCAVALESKLGIDDWQRLPVAQPAPVAPVAEVDETSTRAVA